MGNGGLGVDDVVIFQIWLIFTKLFFLKIVSYTVTFIAVLNNYDVMIMKLYCENSTTDTLYSL